MQANQVGFIGIGRMGVRMAARLISAGFKLAVHDANKLAAAPLLERGARWCASPAEVVQSCATVMSCLPGPEEVEVVMEGPGGILSAPRAGSGTTPLLIEMSTIGPAQSRALAWKARDAGLAYIDAPISNGVGPAERGELTIMVGGARADYERAEPLLRHLGNRLYHLGDVGAGNFAKIANQVIYLSYVASVCETARMARELDLNMPTFVDVMRHSVAGRPMMTQWEERITNGDRSVGFAVGRVLKDLELGADICVEHAINAPVLDAVIATYQGAADNGHANLDMTAIYST
jgi:3-hydroxyisobutyrate dehydrogenase